MRIFKQHDADMIAGKPDQDEKRDSAKKRKIENTMSADQFTKWYLSRLHADPRRVKAATYFCTRSTQELLCRAIQGKRLASPETLRSVAGYGVYGAAISSTLSIETQRALEAACPEGWIWTRWAAQNFVVMPFLVSASMACELEQIRDGGGGGGGGGGGKRARGKRKGSQVAMGRAIKTLWPPPRCYAVLCFAARCEGILSGAALSDAASSQDLLNRLLPLTSRPDPKPSRSDPTPTPTPVKHFQHYGVSAKTISAFFVMLRKRLPKIMPSVWKVYFPAVYVIQNYVSRVGMGEGRGRGGPEGTREREGERGDIAKAQKHKVAQKRQWGSMIDSAALPYHNVETASSLRA